MNKKIITGLLVLMGISIVGIIAVQLVWMNNAFRVKNELFGRGASEALSQTVRRLEDIHDVMIFNKMALPDSTSRQLHRPVLPAPRLHRRQPPAPPRPITIIRQNQKNGAQTQVELRMQADSGNAFVYHYSTATGKISREKVSAKDSSVNREVIVVQTDTLHHLDSVVTAGLGKIDSLVTSIDTFRLIRPDFSNRVHLKASRLKNVASRVVTEISAWNEPEIDPQLLEDILREELLNRNIPIAFEYGVLNDSLVVMAPAPADTTALLATPFKTELYPSSIFRKNFKLALFFPSRERFIYTSLSWLLVASSLFSIVILLTFAASIFFILKQKKISEIKSDFINNMTHEFKTPIATISVAADSIFNEKVLADPAKLRYFAGMIKKENNRMNRQVEDILTIARLDKKEFEFRWETVNLHDLVREGVEGIEIQVEKKGGSISAHLDATNPIIVADRTHLTNAIYNLLDNACKYSPQAPDITLSTRNTTSGIILSVADKGIGMTRQVQGKIFERFYRQSSGNVHNVKGFGLGLSYVKAVVEANGGTISVHSEPGKGSTFELSLPFTF